MPAYVLDRQWIYLVVYRGILADIAPDLATAEAQLRSFSFERLLLWYHDLYAPSGKVSGVNGARSEGFLHDVTRWYEEGYVQNVAGRAAEKAAVFLRHSSLLGKRSPAR